MEHEDDELNELPDWRWMFDPNVEHAPAEFDLEAQWAATGRGVKEWRAGHALGMWCGHAKMLAKPPYNEQRPSAVAARACTSPARCARSSCSAASPRG